MPPRNHPFSYNFLEFKGVVIKENYLPTEMSLDCHRSICFSRYTGATRSDEEFKWLADYVVESHKKTINFARYKRQLKKVAATTWLFIDF
jgi:hypothetical protein